MDDTVMWSGVPTVSTEVWLQTNELRILRANGERDRLQQALRELSSNAVRWEDVPVVTERK